MLKRRLLFAALFLACAALLGYGYYLQYAQGLEPCPLCIVQRAFFALLGITALSAACHNCARLGVRIYASLVLLFAGGGAATAARQVWLQHLPPEKVPECGPGLDYWLQTLPITQTIQKIFRGTGDCAEVDWTFLGLSIAEWSLLCFVAMAGVALFILLNPGRPVRDMNVL